jgi:ubiquinone/menaquinone biosynthesis C-methylase UbiE
MQDALSPELVERARKISWGHMLFQAIHVAATLELPELLRAAPRHVDDLAEATGSHAPSLYRLLRLLASEGIFTEAAERIFALTPLATLLLAGIPGSQRARAVRDGSEFTWRPWGELLYSVQTGAPAFDHVFSVPYFDYFRAHPEAATVFNAYMVELTLQSAEAVVAAYDFAAFRHVVDVGGGRGAQVIALLRSYPHLQATLFDTPEVVAEGRAQLEAAGVADRCVAVEGDFFTDVPKGADAYILKYILHDWDDDRAREILRCCRRSLEPQARLLVVETLIPPGDEPSYGKYLDVTMLVFLHGRERTEGEYRALLQASGFQLTRVVTTPTELSVLEAVSV